MRSFRVIEEVLSNTWVELAVASDITGQKCFLILMLRPQTHSLLDWEPTSCLIFVQTVGQQLISARAACGEERDSVLLVEVNVRDDTIDVSGCLLGESISFLLSCVWL